MEAKTNSGAAHSSSHKPNPKPSKSELMSSAKLVADAAKSKLHHEPNKADKSELAGAAADLLNAASHYGKLDEKGVGKLIGKAETFLHKYETSHSTTTGTTTATSEHTHDPSGSGYGQYIKMAEEILKKQSDGTQSSESGGDHRKKGEYLKMAGDFLKKH